jgi:hypothetical protein
MKTLYQTITLLYYSLYRHYHCYLFSLFSPLCFILRFFAERDCSIKPPIKMLNVKLSKFFFVPTNSRCSQWALQVKFRKTRMIIHCNEFNNSCFVGFYNAPVTKLISLGVGGCSLLASVLNAKPYLHLQLTPHLTTHHQVNTTQQ